MTANRRDKGEGTVFFNANKNLWIARYTHESSGKRKDLSGKTE